MKNSSWFIALPLLMIAYLIFNIVRAFLPTISTESSGFMYLFGLISLSVLLLDSYILIYYRQKKALIYTFGFSVSLTLTHYIIFGLLQARSGTDNLVFTSGNLYEMLRIIPVLNIMIGIAQVFLASQLRHERLRFWFMATQLTGLATVFAGVFIPMVMSDFFVNNSWIYNLLALVYWGAYLAFFIELPTIKRNEDDEEEGKVLYR